MKLDDLVKDLVKSFQPGFAAKNIQIRFENSGNCSFVGDKEGWLRVANNLVGNALRYCEAGNRVLVSVHESSANLKLAVSDDGNGIAKDDLPNVFDRFYRASSTRSRAEGGSGLGLAIVKAVVESQGGEIVVASDIGKGTSFEVLVPRSPVVHPFISFLNKDA
jgi:signal transduction histidine kinase